MPKQKKKSPAGRKPVEDKKIVAGIKEINKLLIVGTKQLKD